MSLVGVGPTMTGDASTPKRRWWRIDEQQWYVVVMAVLVLVAAAITTVEGVRRVWPDPDPTGRR